MHIIAVAVEMLRDSFPNSLSLKVTKIWSTKIIKIEGPLPNDFIVQGTRDQDFSPLTQGQSRKRL